MTSTLLLQGLKRTGNQTLWSDYVQRYRPMLVGYARRLGLPEADAEDVAQQVLFTFAEAYRSGKYDRAQGRLHAWLFGIARTTLKSHRSRAARERQIAGGTGNDEVLAQLEDPEQLSRAWEDEWQQAVLRQCLLEVSREVEATTIQAFELFARQGRPAREVAAELKISENAVFGAKRRVLRRIREMLPRMEEIW